MSVSTLRSNLSPKFCLFYVLLWLFIPEMMRKLTLPSKLPSFCSFCRFNGQTIWSRIAAHVASSNPSVSFHRRQSVFSVFISSAKTGQLTEVMPSRTQPHRTTSETKSRNFSSSKVNTDESGMDSWKSYAADWSKHELLMATCSGFWCHLPDGANVIASYVDTAAAVHKAERRRMPTALMVPSGMSDSIELKPLLDVMVKHGWRIVIPDVIGM